MMLQNKFVRFFGIYYMLKIILLFSIEVGRIT